MKATNGHSSSKVKKDTTVILKSTKSPNIFALQYQGKVLGHVDTNDVNDIRFIPVPKKKEFSQTESEKISSGLKKARQMKLQLMNTIESFLN
jgi:hypothetical protein